MDWAVHGCRTFSGGNGYQAGLAGTRKSLAVFAVAVTFSVVIELIADLDLPQEGILKVSQQPLIDLQQSMKVPPP